jgi:hypothetical protein
MLLPEKANINDKDKVNEEEIKKFGSLARSMIHCDPNFIVSR